MRHKGISVEEFRLNSSLACSDGGCSSLPPFDSFEFGESKYFKRSTVYVFHEPRTLICESWLKLRVKEDLPFLL